MSAGKTTKTFLDGTRTSYSQRVWGEDTTSGPYQPMFREESIQGVEAITAHDTNVVTGRRQFAVICTVEGNVKMKFADGSTFTYPAKAGLTMFPWEVIQVFVTGTTATATYYNLI